MGSCKSLLLNKHTNHFAFQFLSKKDFSYQRSTPQAMTDQHFNQSIDLSVCLTLSFSNLDKDHPNFLRQRNSYCSMQYFVPL
jgi:hypothetical protein